MMIFYSIKVKGLGGWLHEIVASPFGLKPLWASPLLLFFNVLFNLVEYISKPLSHSLRLYDGTRRRPTRSPRGTPGWLRRPVAARCSSRLPGTHRGGGPGERPRVAFGPQQSLRHAAPRWARHPHLADISVPLSIGLVCRAR
jgi:hypothetical protein